MNPFHGETVEFVGSGAVDRVKRWPCHYCGAKLLAEDGVWITVSRLGVAVWACPKHGRTE